MNTTEREFLSKVWFVVASFVAWNALTLLYGCFDPGKELELSAIGRQSYTERAVLGIPTLFVGYAISYALALLILRDRGALEFRGVPAGEKLTSRFIKWAFWVIMFVPVLTLGWLHFGVLHHISFVSGCRCLKGWSIYQFAAGSWQAHGINPADDSHPTVKPGWMPLIYLVLVVITVVSYLLLPWLVRRDNVKRGR